MSRVGKKPISIPSGVAVTITDSLVLIKGPKGELKRSIHPEMKASINGQEILIAPAKMNKRSFALWGLTRSLVANMVEGVSMGFQKKLEFEGIGYRANLEGNVLILQLGFTHPVKILAPEAISFKVEKNLITVSGVDKERVGEIAAKIRDMRPPEPYKGKGIHYLGEIIRRKAGKKAVASGG